MRTIQSLMGIEDITILNQYLFMGYSITINNKMTDIEISMNKDQVSFYVKIVI